MMLMLANQIQQTRFELLRDETRPHPGKRMGRKEAGLLGPTKSRLGSDLGVTCTELGPLGFNCEAQLGGVQHGATWARLDGSWAWHTHLGPV